MRPRRFVYIYLDRHGAKKKNENHRDLKDPNGFELDFGAETRNFTSFWSRILAFTNEDCRRRSHANTLAKIRLSKQEKSLDFSR